MYKINWITSPKDNEIELFSSHKALLQTKSPMLFIGGIHGDEPEGVYLAESLKVWLESVDNKQLNDFLLIPCINIDGYKANERVNSNGVDLNRNFPSKKWSSFCEEKRYFPGDHPASEIETQALVQLISTTKPRLIFHFHSWKPCIVVTGPPNLAEAKHLHNSSNFEIVQDIGYPTPGSLGDYAWNDLNHPVICTEDEEHRKQDLPWQHFGEGLKKILLK